MQFVPLCDENLNIEGDYLRYDYYEDNTQKWEWVKLRPDSLTYDENGVALFDKDGYSPNGSGTFNGGYYSSAASQSFIVDNKTGYIYKLENLIITSIADDDLVRADNNSRHSGGDTYKLSINEKGELVFTDIMPNKDIYVRRAFTDKYGYTFVSNSEIEEVDSKNKIIYFKNNHDNKIYLCDENKKIYIGSYENSTKKYTLQKVYIHGIPQNVDSNITCFRLYSLSLTTEWKYNGYYKGKGIGGYHRGETLLIEDSLSLSGDLSSYASWFDNETICVFKNDILYSYHVNFEECYNKNKTLTLDDFTVVANDAGLKFKGGHSINVGNDKMIMRNVYYRSSLTGTKYYQLVRNGNSLQLKELEDKNYSQNIYIFQPINRE